MISGPSYGPPTYSHVAPAHDLGPPRSFNTRAFDHPLWTCAKAACHGKAKLTSGKGTLASGKFKIAKGHASTVKLSLTSAGKKAFAHAHSHAVSAKLVVSVSNGHGVTKTIKVH